MKEFFNDLRRDAQDTDEKNTALCTIMLTCACLFMFVVNIFTKSYIMVAITGCLALWSTANGIIYRKTRNFAVLSAGVLSAITVMMMYFVVSGGEDGFSIVWLLMAPPLGIFFFKLLYGGAFSIILGLLTTLYLWTPLHELGYHYSDTYKLRFPIVYFIELLVCLYINYTILMYRKKQVMLLEMAQQASSTKSDFLANMSHEIRTPLNAVVGMCELILRENDISNTVKDYCFNIRNSGRSLLSIINDILDFSKIESGKMEIIHEDFSIASTLNDVINMAITRKADKPVELIVKCGPDIPSVVNGDELRIRQVMINLVTNAIKFTNEGAVTIKLSCTKQSYGVNLSVSVKDTGIGISPENLENLFSSFQQINTRKNRAVEGTGLGLAISKKFIRSMGGFINVSSTHGEGSEFKFVIPLKTADAAPFVTVKEPEKVKAVLFADSSKYTIPQVENEYRSLVRSLSATLGVDIKLYSSFKELRLALSDGGYTHIFTGRTEYAENRQYFTDIADKTCVVIIQDRINSIEVPPNMKCIYKPFYALNMASVLNNEVLMSNVNERRNSDMRFTAPKARVLIVDDNVINLKVAVGLMRPYHMQVMTADSGRAAISMLRSKDIDIVFMDHMMPEMDGIEATAEIRKMNGDYYKKLPVIALTANAVNGVRDMYIEAGLNDFIAKPIELAALDRVLKTWLPKEYIKLPADNGNSSNQKRRRTDTEAAQPVRSEDEFFSTDTGISYTGGDVDAYNEILEMYVRKSPEKHDCIKQLFEEKNWKNYIIEVHALKSTSLTIGSKTLSNLAKELELAGKAGNYSLIEEKNGTLLEMYLKVAQLGREYLKLDEKDAAAAEADNAPTEEMTAEAAAELIEGIISAIDSFDGDEAAELCKTGYGYSVNEKRLKPLLEQIKACIDDFEYDNAAEKAKQALEEITAK